MRNKLFTYLVVVILCSITVAFVPKGNAAYPEKPIEFVTNSGPGGGGDIFIRTVTHILEKEGIVKQNIRVVNKTGGGGSICMDYIASKKGDPYVVGAFATSTLNSMITKNTIMKYEDITLIANMLTDANFIFAGYNAPYNNVKELNAWAKKSGREVNVAISNIGGDEHLGAHRFGKGSGVPLNIVSFKGGESIIAFLGGHADLKVGNIEEMMGQIEAKKVKILAVMSDKRIPSIPDVPTLKEQGFDMISIVNRGFWAPQDFPPYAIKYWEDAFAQVMKTKAFKGYIVSAVENFLTGKRFREFLDDYVVTMTQDLKELGLLSEKK